MRLYPFLLCMSAATLLGAGCKEKEQVPNPFFAEWTTPFEVPPFDKILPDHYQEAIEKGMEEQNAEIQALVEETEAPNFERVIGALDRSGALLLRAYSAFAQVKNANASDRLQQMDLEISPEVSAHYDNIYLNAELFAKIKTVYDHRGEYALTPEQLRLTEETYKQFVRSGALLNAADQQRLKEINQKLTTLSIQFGNNLMAENKDFQLVIEKVDELKGLPAEVMDAARSKTLSTPDENRWVFTLNKTSLIPFLTYAENRNLREKLYTAYLKRCDNGNDYDNNQIVNDILQLRIEKASLMGYHSYAEMVLSDRMAQTPQQVYGLLDALWKPALDLARRELEEMQALKFEQTGDSTFAAWDWWFYAEKIRTQRYNLDESALKPYFSLDNVKSGIFQLSNRLWGVSFRPISVPTYHPDCMVYEVLDRDNSHLGVLYFDLFQRDNKRVGAWCSTLRREHYATDGKTRIAPIVTITANFTPPTNEKEPALLNLDETQTLFHEFGHALHQLFSQVHYEGNGGVERDFVELPSQIMENWATEPAMLRFYAKHYVSGEPLSEQLIDQIRRSVKFNQGFATTELLAASLTDMDLHTIEAYQPVNLDDFEKNALYTRRGMLPQIEPRYRYPYFNHIFNGGYAAGYYSYLWAEVLDKDAYQAFVESGDLFNREVAQRFRTEILERGGSADGMTLYRNFRGKEPDQTALMIARGLIELPAADSTDATDASIPMVE